MRLVWQLVVVVVVAMVGSQCVAAVEGNPWAVLALGLLTAGLSVVAYRWVVRRTEHREVVEAAWQGAGAATARGTLIGVALFGAVIANLAFLGHYTVQGMGTVTGAVGLIGFMAAASVTEELLFRGVLFRVIEERTGTWIALVLTAVLFGLAHLPNPNADLWGATAIAIEAGGMLAAAYVATRNLWVPIGLHFGWNFVQAGIFSTEVSGNGASQGLLDSSLSGPALITGGDLGPEGSLYSIGFCVLAMIVFLWLARRRGHIVPFRGRADRAPAVTTLSQ